MSALPKVRVTVKDYLALDRQSKQKFEFVGGEIIAMAGASREHNLINYNLTRVLGAQLAKRPCEGYAGDMRGHIPMTGEYVYPDQVIVCGEPEFLPNADLDTLINPTVIVEVLSSTTANYDQGDKLASYRYIASLREYVMIAQHTYHVIHWTRHTGVWAMTETRDPASVVRLASIQCRLKLAEVYAKVPFHTSP